MYFFLSELCIIDKIYLQISLSIDLTTCMLQICERKIKTKNEMIRIINHILEVFFFFSSGTDFVKFVNMLMNDTTFLLDESMDTLKSIRELQDQIENKTEFSRLDRVRLLIL